MSKDKKRKKKLRQLPCPFYGMLGVTAGFYPQKGGGDACGFKFSGKFATCSMESPNWDLCKQHNRPENQDTIARIMDNFVIVPENISIREHYKEVMRKEYP
jgi:hypothetical protein